MSAPRVFLQVGQRFGRGVVTDPEVRVPFPSRSTTQRGARLRCECGTEYLAALGELRRGLVRSCGCMRVEAAIRNARAATAAATKHGMWGHPLYVTWYDMLQRCENPRDVAYKYYGARGIVVCDRWHDVRLFIEDIEGELGPRPAGMTLDRVNNDDFYGPGRVRWATWRQQLANRRRSASA